MPALPARPSREHLRKQAKRLARARSLRLADAQALVATEYGFRTWPDLVRHVGRVQDSQLQPFPLFAAVQAGDVDAARRLLAAGANPRIGDGRESPLHAAARRGPLALVEALIAGGAFEWQTDAEGRTPLDIARVDGVSTDQLAIVALLDRGSTADKSFRAAVEAIQTGDVPALEALLDANPGLLRERIAEPDVYRAAGRRDYFLDPRLFWFVANNPALVDDMPANIIDVARAMIDRGVDKSDLDYTLELAMTSAAARVHGLQRALMRTLLAPGAEPGRQAVMMAAAHREVDALRMLLECGSPMSAAIAAALGDGAALREELARADATDIQDAFGLAVINGNVEAARIALQAGADPDAFLPVHAHSTALHQAALNDDVPMIELLLERGAREDQRDKLWEATPLGWSIHGNCHAARSALQRR